jgi:DNA-directed RNA polymerase specialized sigma24 family protein
MQERPEGKVRRDARADADYRSCEEFTVAMRSLDPTEIKRLGLQGRTLALGTLLTGNDLLSEAIRATADGERRWPNEVPIGAYLYMAMKSVASNERRKEAHVVRVPVGGDANGRGDRFAEICDPAPDPEMKAILADAEARAFSLLEGDELAQWLLLSRLEGESVAEFCHSHDLSGSQYEAVSKRLQRKLRSLKAGA